MANWKKVLVSGSEISVAGITSSQVPDGTESDDVVVLGGNGGFKKVTQTSIQGVTTATFKISGSTGNDTFDATGDTLIFTGSHGASTTIINNGTNTTVGITLPTNTVSGSQQINIANTIGFTSFSSSFAASITTNETNISTNDTDITTLQGRIEGLAASSSQLTAASTSFSTDLTTANSNLTSIQGSITAIQSFTGSVVTNNETGSFLLSESIVGTENEITVVANGAQGVKIGLPDNVTIGGRLEANKLVIQGETIADTAAATVAGNTIQGNATTDIHRFTGSLQITGAFEIDNGSNDIKINNIGTNDQATVDDILVRANSTGIISRAGSNIKLAISGAFDEVSASIASDIAALETTTTSNNTNAINALEATSGSLETSASMGIYFSASEGGSSVGLGQSSSFVASGDGLSVAYNANGNNGIITYTVDPAALGGAIGAYSSSAQLQTVLDDIYVPYTDVPISGAVQLQTLGFITSSTFSNLDGVPVGLISGAADGDNGTQAQIKINDNVINISGLSTTDSPTFNNLTVTNNLVVTEGTTTISTEQLNIEDQFILINSGASGGDNDPEMDGGVIVDSGNGKGALLMYKKGYGVWAFKGATDPVNGVDFGIASTADSPLVPEVVVATVSNGTNGDVGPTTAPSYGAANSDYQKGQMHINTSDDTIWIYV